MVNNQQDTDFNSINQLIINILYAFYLIFKQPLRETSNSPKISGIIKKYEILIFIE